MFGYEEYMEKDRKTNKKEVKILRNLTKTLKETNTNYLEIVEEKDELIENHQLQALRNFNICYNR